jgi:SNF2 family DNA or RNA helicase
VLADLAADGEHIECTTEYRHKEIIKGIPGARWQKDTGTWHLPLTWSSCLALRSSFKHELEIGNQLAHWALDYRENTLTRALELRNAFQAEGDADLFPHQRADVQFLAHVRRAILASEMGVGKTASAIRTMVELTRRGEEVFPALIVCPNSVKRSWKREIERWWPGLRVVVISGTAVQRKKAFKQPAHIHIINFEATRSHSRLAPYGSIALKRCIDCGGEDPKVTTMKCQVHERELNLIPYRTVIADEAHRVKDPTSQQSRALKAAAAGAEFRYAMTGTPIANNIIDLWSILNFVDPVEWPSKTRWIDHMVDVVTNVFGGLVSASIRAGFEEEFRQTIDPRMRRMTKAVVLPFLPPIMPERRDVAMTPKQEKAYNDMATRMIAEMEEGMLVTTSPMIQTMRLLQLASSYGEVETRTVIDPETGEEKIREKLILTAPSSKIDAFMEDLDDFEGRATIVFTVSSQLANLLSAALTKKKIDHGMITGAQNEWEREQAKDRFQKGYTKFIIMTIAAGGTGITLTTADTVVYLQRDWSLINMDQSIARAHRIGSEIHDSITRIDYVTPGSAEEGVIGALEGKNGDLQELVRDVDLLKKLIYGELAA